MIELENGDESIIEELQERIHHVRSDLSTCQQLTDQMCNVLEGFQQRLSMLESTMLPIHKQTQSLTIAQKNIDVTIEEVDLIQKHGATADLSESNLDEKSIEHSLEQFCSQVDEILAAKAFFQARQLLPNAQLHILSCHNLLKKAIKTCENEFKSVIQADSKPMEFNQLPWPLPTDYQPISSSTLNKLGLLASCLQKCSTPETFMKHLIQVRTDTVRASLETASCLHHKSSTGAVDSIAEDSQRMAQKMKSKLLRVKKKISSEQYERGSHVFIKFMQFLLFLMKIEQSFIEDLFALTECPSSDMAICMSSVSNSLFECVIKEAEELMKKKSDSKVLILLDILDNVNSIIEMHKHQDLSSLKLVAAQFIEAIQKAIEYRKEKIAHSYSKQQFPVDGGYDTITIQTMNFISRLFEYKPTIESSSPPLPKLEAIISLFLTALDSSLEQKARSYKNISLMQIFLINNANYILRNIRTSTDLSSVLSKSKVVSDIEQRFKSALDAYRQTAWSKLLSYIDKRDDIADLTTSPLTQSQKKFIKQCFSGFNAAFEELYSTQKQFSVPDSDLRSQLRNTNVETIVPKYSSFLDRYSNVEFSNHPGKYIKYHASVLEQMLNKFFDEEA